MSWFKGIVMMDLSDGATGNFDEDQSVIEYQYEMRHSIVYTTKLDEMNIFKKNTADMCVDTIINSIIKESKPKLKKRKWTRASSDYSFEDLSCFIKTFNRKVARITIKNNHLLSMCRPVRVVLKDIKYILRTQSDASKNFKINEQIPTYNISRKLEVKMVYDQQHREADMYLLDKHSLVQGYNKFPIDNINDDTFYSLTYDKNVFEVSCCCWYNREKFLKSLAILPNKTVRFMRKPHKCAINLCRCCCRNKAIKKSDVTTSTSPSLLQKSESPSVWLNKMPKKHVSKHVSISAKSTYTLFSKSLSMVAKPLVKLDIPVIEEWPFLHSTNIDFGEEYYVIGTDGQIKLHLKHCKDEQKLPSLISKTTNNVVGNICCWYKREEFANSLLALRALPETVNYIRGVHPCSTTFCSCCCMPSNTEKTEITPLPKAARHTNDLVSKKVNIKVRFSDIVEKPVNPTSAEPVAVRNTNDMVSFHVSLSSFEMISKGENRSCPPLITEDDPQRSVRVLVEKSSKQKNKTVIECTQPLNNFTTKELRMLDLIFCAVKHAFPTRQTFELKQTKNKKGQPKKSTAYVHNKIYPLLLNKQLSIAAELRNKRFLPPLKAHLEKYHVPITDNCSSWLRIEQRSRKAKQKGLQQKQCVVARPQSEVIGFFGKAKMAHDGFPENDHSNHFGASGIH